MTRFGWGLYFGMAALLVCPASPVHAQNYSFDARRIALGGAGGTPNVASKLVEQERRYKSILIPVGLVKMLTDVRVFYPNREDFDFSRAVEYANSPLHFVFGRKKDMTARSMFRDILHAQLQPDLNAYSGFQLPVVTDAEGIVDLTWGHTFFMHRGERSFQSIYVGAGPYMASTAYFDFDAQLEQILSGNGNRYVPSATMGLGGGETDQIALDITGSYRARFPLFGGSSAASRRNGLYVMANYHHLQGFHLDEFDARLRLDTEANGLLVPNPPDRPLEIIWQSSSKGIGLSMDFGASMVINRWDFGLGVSGVQNRIKWHDIKYHDLSLLNLLNGVNFTYVKYPLLDTTKKFSMPVTYTADLSYHRDRWSAFTEGSHGLGGDNFRAALEYRIGSVELRGAGRYSNGSWYPAAGVGFNFTRTFGVDAGFYGAQSFLESEPHLGLAISLRIDRK